MSLIHAQAAVFYDPAAGVSAVQAELCWGFKGRSVIVWGL